MIPQGVDGICLSGYFQNGSFIGLPNVDKFPYIGGFSSSPITKQVNQLLGNDSHGSKVIAIPFDGAGLDSGGVLPTPDPRSAFTQIEAENYNNQSGVQTESCIEGGENVGYIENGDYAVYSNIDFGSGAASFQARVASATSGGNIEIRLDSLTGTLIGTCPVATCNVSGVSGKHDLYLKFTGGSGCLFNLNWFKFGTGSNSGSLGDLNSDGQIDSVDLMSMKKHLLGLETIGNPTLADLDASGTVDRSIMNVNSLAHTKWNASTT